MSSDVRALGRLSETMSGGVGGRSPRRRRVPIRRGPGPARRRRRVPRLTTLAGIVLVAGLTWVVLADGWPRDQAPPPAQTDLADVPARPAGDEVSRGEPRALPGATFARVADLRLTLPFGQPLLVAFGEADRAEALAMEPVGQLLGNHHDRYEPVPDRRGPDYRVLAPGGRARPATSAASIVMPAGSTVLAPVTGRVVRVRDYAMEGGVRDFRVVIEVAAQPSLHVLLSSVESPAVGVGDAVRAGETPVGQVRLLPFTRGVDGHLDQRLPHVRIEVQPAGEPDPADPNERAAEPGRAAAGR